MTEDNRRCIVIGDVHGCNIELLELLARCEYSSEDRLIFAGDLVDKGPSSRYVFQLAMGFNAECVLGNHDEKHLRWNKWNRRIAAGENVVNPMKTIPEYWEMDDAEWEYINKMPLWIHIDDTWTVVHAGLESNGKTVEEMDPGVMLRIRDVHGDTGNYHQKADPSIRAEGAVRWAEKWKGPRSVIYGHAPGYEVKIDRDGDAVCLGIDTGCVHGGLLTAVILQPPSIDFKFVQVRACYKYADPYFGEEDYLKYAQPQDS